MHCLTITSRCGKMYSRWLFYMVAIIIIYRIQIIGPFGSVTILSAFSPLLSWFLLYNTIIMETSKYVNISIIKLTKRKVANCKILKNQLLCYNYVRYSLI